jgi:four helix bundle protein
MTRGELIARMKRFSLEVIRLVESLPRGRIADALGGQLLRCGTSAGANYRAACRARSVADFISKMGIVEEELDESVYWLELLVEAAIVQRTRVDALLKEANELLAITVSSIRTARRREPSRASRSSRPAPIPQSAVRNPQ